MDAIAEQENRQTLTISNLETMPLEVMVEMAPDRYVLQPGDQMEIEADLRDALFHINPYSGGVQIYPGNAFDHVAKINGVVAESWIAP
jgi:hypothetical protein